MHAARQQGLLVPVNAAPDHHEREGCDHIDDVFPGAAIVVAWALRTGAAMINDWRGCCYARTTQGRAPPGVLRPASNQADGCG